MSFAALPPHELVLGLPLRYPQFIEDSWIQRIWRLAEKPNGERDTHLSGFAMQFEIGVLFAANMCDGIVPASRADFFAAAEELVDRLPGSLSLLREAAQTLTSDPDEDLRRRVLIRLNNPRRELRLATLQQD